MLQGCYQDHQKNGHFSPITYFNFLKSTQQMSLGTSVSHSGHSHMTFSRWSREEVSICFPASKFDPCHLPLLCPWGCVLPPAFFIMWLYCNFSSPSEGSKIKQHQINNSVQLKPTPTFCLYVWNRVLERTIVWIAQCCPQWSRSLPGARRALPSAGGLVRQVQTPLGDLDQVTSVVQMSVSPCVRRG